MSFLEKTSSAIQYYGTQAMIRIILAMPYHAAIALGRLIMLLVWLFMPASPQDRKDPDEHCPWPE